MKRLEKPEILFIVLTAVLFVVGRIGVLIWQEQNGILVAGKILISIEIILFAVLFYLQKKNQFRHVYHDNGDPLLPGGCNHQHLFSGSYGIVCSGTYRISYREFA